MTLVNCTVVSMNNEVIHPCMENLASWWLQCNLLSWIPEVFKS